MTEHLAKSFAPGTVVLGLVLTNITGSGILPPCLVMGNSKRTVTLLPLDAIGYWKPQIVQLHRVVKFEGVWDPQNNHMSEGGFGPGQPHFYPFG